MGYEGVGCRRVRFLSVHLTLSSFSVVGCVSPSSWSVTDNTPPKTSTTFSETTLPSRTDRNGTFVSRFPLSLRISGFVCNVGRTTPRPITIPDYPVELRWEEKTLLRVRRRSFYRPLRSNPPRKFSLGRRCLSPSREFSEYLVGFASAVYNVGRRVSEVRTALLYPAGSDSKGPMAEVSVTIPLHHHPLE